MKLTNQSMMKKEGRSNKELANDILYVGFGEDTSTNESERYYVSIHKSGVKMYIVKPGKDKSKKVCLTIYHNLPTDYSIMTVELGFKKSYNIHCVQ